MQTRSSSRLISDQSSNPTSSTNPKGRNRRRSKQRIENSNLKEHSNPIVTMVDQRSMAELLRAPTEWYAKAIGVLPILTEHFELKHSLINMMTTDQFFRLEKDNPHDHIRWGSPPVARKRTLAFDSHLGGSCFKDRYKDLLRVCPHHGFTELHQLDTFYNALNPADQDSLNVAASGNLLERSTQDMLTIIENKSKVRNSRSKPIASQVKACDVNSNSSEIAKLTYAVNQQTNAMTTAMTAILKQFQANPPPAPVKTVEETCVTCGGAHPYYQCLAVGGNTFLVFRDNIQGYVSAAAVNYNQGNPGYHPPGLANQIRPSGFAQLNVQNNQNRFGPPQGFNSGNEQSYQAPAPQNQNVHLNEWENFRRMNEANMKAMQTQIDMVKNELRNEMKSSIQTSLSNQTNEIKNMMASLLQINTASTSGSGSLPSNTVANPKGELKAITTRSGLVIAGPTVPTPSRSINPEVDECIEETFTDPDLAEYIIKKMLKALLSNKEKLQELANTLLNENCSAVILKKLLEKLRDPGKFLILCGFSELKCKALADLANRAICTPAGIARDVFVPVGKFTFPANFVIVGYESDPRVPLILGRPFLRTARALIDVHGEEMILRDGDERLTLNMRHDTSSYSNQPQKESISLINVFNISSEDFLEDLFPNQPSGNPTFLPHPELTSPEVNNDIFDSEGCNFADELPPEHDDNLQFDIESDLKEIEFLLYQDKDSSLKDSIDQKNLESDAGNDYDDPFDSKEEKIKEFKLLIDELDLPCDFYPPVEYDSFISQDFSRVDALPSTNNEDKIFNPGILIQEKPVEIITRVAQDKKLAISNASLVLEDFDPPFYEPLFFKEVPNSKMLLPFSSENEEKVFKPEIHTSEKFYSYFIPELSHQGYKVFKINQIFKSLMKICFFYCGKDTHILADPHHHFYPLDQFKYGGIGSSSAT
uniref:Reverse transcriptase domain-containing protein n=1 Tax=Tanacetum cinerariifolium TaxID=118510 RepID=A0A699HPT2_TANCI|nr:hypothetical protein [Tanacetum cinerariifolium]